MNVFLAWFLNVSGNLGGTASGLRRGCGRAANRPRRVYLLQPIPRGSAIYERLSNKTGKDGSLAGSGTPRAVGLANFKNFLQNGSDTKQECLLVVQRDLSHRACGIMSM